MLLNFMILICGKIENIKLPHLPQIKKMSLGLRIILLNINGLFRINGCGNVVSVEGINISYKSEKKRCNQ